jgi:ABC-2 type transport system permease protein
MTVIYVLWLRQLKRYFRSKARIIGSLGQPLIFLLAFGFGFGSIFQKASGKNYLDFLVPGIICMGILFTAVFTGLEIIWDRQFGFLKETLIAPISRFQIMIGRTLGGATISLFQGLLVLGISYLVGFRITHWETFPLALLFMILIALLFTSLGTAIASQLEDMQGFQLIMNFLIMPIFFFSGALFPPTGIPKPLEFLMRLNPLSYGVDGLRTSLGVISYFSIESDLLILGSTTLLLLVIGTYLFSKIQI